MDVDVDARAFNALTKQLAQRIKKMVPQAQWTEEMEEKLEALNSLPETSRIVHRQANAEMQKPDVIKQIVDVNEAALTSGKLPMLPPEQCMMIAQVYQAMSNADKSTWWMALGHWAETGGWLKHDAMETMQRNVMAKFPLEAHIAQEFKQSSAQAEADAANIGSAMLPDPQEWMDELSKIEKMTPAQLAEWYKQEQQKPREDDFEDESARNKDNDGDDGEDGQAVWNIAEAKQEASGENKQFYQVVTIMNRRCYDFIKELVASRGDVFPVLKEAQSKLQKLFQQHPMTREIHKQFVRAENLFLEQYFTVDERSLPLIRQFELRDYQERVDDFLQSGLVPLLHEYMVPHVVQSFIDDPHKDRASYNAFATSLRILRQASLICTNMERKLAPLGEVIDNIMHKLNIKPGKPINPSQLGKTKIASQVFKTFTDPKHQGKLNEMLKTFESRDNRSDARNMVEIAMPSMLSRFDRLNQKIEDEQALAAAAASAVSKQKSQ